ncbi:MAG: hypothetical protein JRD68_05915 [Deltaproteobacteria bacterium]|nr:hypothetical protein [Deltaproteobacteria bacterium]
MKVTRFSENPIIRPLMDDRMGNNINGPSLIRVPDWVADPLGRYYLYFAHHQGDYIRLAYADQLTGPWNIYTPGVLDLKDSFFNDHLASPDVVIMPERQEIRMYYHGQNKPDPGPHYQFERVAVSKDGLLFTAHGERLGNPYFRTFQWEGYTYALSMPGKFYRSKDGLTSFERGPMLFSRDMRHSATRIDQGVLQVFYTNAGDCPEKILLSTIELKPDWNDWRITEPVTVLEPEMDYEGGNLSLAPSARGAIFEPARQLRDPCLYEEDNGIYLLYAVAGENGIALAKVRDL